VLLFISFVYTNCDQSSYTGNNLPFIVSGFNRVNRLFSACFEFFLCSSFVHRSVLSVAGVETCAELCL